MSNEEISLETLVLLAREGDRDAYTEIMDRFRDNAHARAYGVLKDYHLAQDVVQEAFSEAFFSLDKLREPAAFPGWFKRIVIKRIDRIIRRKQHPTTSMDAATDITYHDEESSETVDDAQLAETLDLALNTLPEHERQVARDYYFDDKSQKEIAEELNVPITTIKKRLYATRQRLKGQLGDLHPDHERSSQAVLSPEHQLFTAIRNGYLQKLQHLLINRPSLIDTRNEDGLSPLLYAAHTAHHSGDQRAVEFLLTTGATLDLYTAAALGYQDHVVNITQRNPQSLHTAGPWGRTTLHWAVSGGHDALVEWLIGHGVQLEHSDNFGCTPIHLTAELGHSTTTSLLVQSGANIHAKLKNGKSVLHLAAQSRDFTIVETLLRDKANLDVFAAATLGLKDQMKQLLKQDPYLIQAKLPFGATPLHTAAEDGQFEMAQYLLEQGAQIDIVTAAQLGWTDHVLTLLNQHPKRVNQKAGSFGYTPLHTAITKGQQDIARLLLIHGAEIHATDHMYQKTPLGEALYFGNESMAQLLYHHGAQE